MLFQTLIEVQKVLKCYYWNISETVLKYYGIIPVVSLIKIET